MTGTDFQEHSTAVELPSSLGTFEVTRYRPDGSYSIPSLMQVCGILGGAGMLLGAVSAFIGQYFWFIILFPLGIGFLMGFVGTLLVHRFKIRNPWICSLAGLSAGLFAMLALHYTNFRMFEADLKAQVDPIVLDVARNLDGFKQLGEEAPEELRDLVTELEADPAGLAVLNIDTLPEYLHYRATLGVEIQGKRGRNGANLGYTGTFIYWGIEVLIVAGVCLALMKSASEEPFCQETNGWKPVQKFGPFVLDKTTVDDWKRGDLTRLTPAESVEKPVLVVSLYPSPGIETEQPVDVFLEKLKVDKEGKESTSSQAKLTFPASAYLTLMAACGALPAMAAEVSEENSESEPESEISPDIDPDPETAAAIV